MLEALKRQRAVVAELRLAAGPVWHDRALVLPSSIGRPLREANVRDVWVAMLKRAGLPEKTRMHDLRHTSPRPC